MILLLASYPGLLTPAFVACSTNVVEGVVKLSHVQWRTWMCGRVAHFQKRSKWVHYQLQKLSALAVVGSLFAVAAIEWQGGSMENCLMLNMWCLY